MMQEFDYKELPQELKKLEGRNYVFEIRLNEYNIQRWSSKLHGLKCLCIKIIN
jgi:hypothetical protein